LHARQRGARVDRPREGGGGPGPRGRARAGRGRRDAVRRRLRARGGQEEVPGQPAARGGQRDDLPRHQRRQHRLQDHGAAGGGLGHRPHHAGPQQAHERRLARLLRPGPGRRRGHHRGTGAGLKGRSRRLALAGLLPAALALQLLASRFPAIVERGYSTGLYPAIAAAGARLIGRLPFSLAEWLVAAFALLVSWRAIRFVGRAARQRGYLRQAGLAAAMSVVTAAGILYLTFLMVWGLNYSREPFAVAAGLDASPPSVPELRAASADLVQRANALREGLPE